MSLKILIIDANQENEHFYKETFQLTNHQIRMVEEIEVAQKIIATHQQEGEQFHMLIFNDHCGVDAKWVEQLKESISIPILMITNSTELSYLLSLEELDVAVYSKSLDSEALKKKVKILSSRIESANLIRIQKEAQKKTSPFLEDFSFSLKLDNNANNLHHILSFILSYLEHSGITEEYLFKIKLGLTEILINAMTHGNLEMSSEILKGRNTHFELWNQELQKRLKNPKFQERFVYVKVKYKVRESLEIMIEDEGSGFDATKFLQEKEKEEETFNVFGRGLMMVKATCDQLEFNEKGTKVKMTYQV